ncbi:MAG: BamA/TamA family outer membrane protein [Planctomycetes bacterium]|nr:BamA/TamA family outer membrane protein [Planctomycetota bacterium]
MAIEMEKQVNRLIRTAVALAALLMAGCQTFTPPNNTRAVSANPVLPAAAQNDRLSTSSKPQTSTVGHVSPAGYSVSQTPSSGELAGVWNQLDVARGQNPLPQQPVAGANGQNYYPQTDAGSGNYFRQPLVPSQAAPPVVSAAPQTGLPPGYTTTNYGTTNPVQSGYVDTGASGVPVAGQPMGVNPYGVDASGTFPDLSSPILPRYQPRERVAPIDVYVQEERTGRVMLGGSVNSDLGVAGQFIVEERNFDLFRPATSWEDVWSGRAWRGAGQNFRLEIMPGNRVERYTVNWTERNLFGYLPVSLSVGGFLFTRRYRDWDEQRLGARVMLGYELTPDLSISSELRGENVKIYDPRVLGVPELDEVLGSNELYTARFRLAHDTRDNPFMATEGHLLELIYDQVFGDFSFPRGQVNYSNYLLMRERADGSGRHVLANSLKFGFSGEDTPVFENFFAGGYSTMRGFSFRGASPRDSDVIVGGRFQMLGSLEYIFPLTADDMLRGIVFCDYGTVESDIEFNSENFRVAPGLGFRVMIPAMGPAPLAFDFAFPVNYADTDDRQVFSFFLGFTR